MRNTMARIGAAAAAGAAAATIAACGGDGGYSSSPPYKPPAQGELITHHLDINAPTYTPPQTPAQPARHVAPPPQQQEAPASAPDPQPAAPQKPAAPAQQPAPDDTKFQLPGAEDNGPGHNGVEGVGPDTGQDPNVTHHPDDQWVQDQREWAEQQGLCTPPDC